MELTGGFWRGGGTYGEGGRGPPSQNVRAGGYQGLLHRVFQKLRKSKEGFYRTEGKERRNKEGPKKEGPRMETNLLKKAQSRGGGGGGGRGGGGVLEGKSLDKLRPRPGAPPKKTLHTFLE